MTRLRRIWHAYSLVWVLVLVMIVSGIIGAFYEHHVAIQAAVEHGRVYQSREFWINFLGHNNDRLFASTLLILIYSLARKWFTLAGSPVSKDGPDERTHLLLEIRADLKRLCRTTLGYTPRGQAEQRGDQ